MTFIVLLLLLLIALLLAGFALNLVFKLLGAVLPNWVKTAIFVAIVVVGVALYVTQV